ncbi:MAG: hypothetical protein LBE13_16715 [Bacteroidales bacterium]|jgi:hypothetical protein|nr:hypothetical protein [Bacteroidales bacterium]
MKYLIWGILIVNLIFFACSRKKSHKFVVNQSEFNQIQKTVNIKIKRYEQALNNIPKDSLQSGLIALQKDYYFFVGNDPEDSANVEQIRSYLNDKVIKQLYQEVQKQYPDLSDMEKEFSASFSLLKYHFPQANIPQVYTAITGLYYEMPIMFNDSVLIIALDMYLGRNYKLYKQLGISVPQYIIQRFAKEYILADCFKEISYQYIKYKDIQGTLLDEMILEGKRLLFTEAVLPHLADTVIYPYSSEKIQWAINNEANIWGYLIEKKYLYSKDNVIIRKFVRESPFTTAFGKQSPGKVGTWIGWQICKSWVEKNPDRPLTDLMNELDAQKILTESKYKPQK